MYIVTPLRPCHTPVGNMSLAVSIKQWTAPEQTKTVCTQGEDVHFSTEGQGTIYCPNSSVDTRKRGINISAQRVASLHRWAPCPGTTCARCLM